MSAAPSWLGVVAVIVSPLVAAFFGGYLVNRWKGRQDHLDKRFDELCENVLMAADLAADYWAGPASADGMQLREAKIIAQQNKIAGMRVMLSEYISKTAAEELELAEASLLRELTGGTFGVHNREASPERILRAQIGASRTIVAVRRARMRDLKGLRTRR